MLDPFNSFLSFRLPSLYLFGGLAIKYKDLLNSYLQSAVSSVCTSYQIYVNSVDNNSFHGNSHLYESLMMVNCGVSRLICPQYDTFTKSLF